MPLSDFFAESDELLAGLGEGSEPLVLTENGKPVAVLEDAAVYYEKRETLALLQILALAKEDIAAGRVYPVEGMLDRICERAKK
ncbi:MAG TPA: antitoxin, Phd family protein [Novosphingobium sp.]|nr:antitoxin, Phd family protein [Novosphingobium sp.]